MGCVQKRGADIAPSETREREGLPCCGELGKAAWRREHWSSASKDTEHRVWGQRGGRFRRQGWRDERHATRRVGPPLWAGYRVHIGVVGDEAWECLSNLWTLFPGTREPREVLEQGSGVIGAEPRPNNLAAGTGSGRRGKRWGAGRPEGRLWG